MGSVRAIAPLLAALLLAAGCGGSSGSERSAGQPPGAPPAQPRSAPPPAWAETQHDSHWLAYSGYCWTAGGSRQCADLTPPACRDPRTPKIVLQKGETIKFHFGFDPIKVGVTAGGSSQRLSADRGPEWKADREGAMIVSVSSQDGTAGYGACLQFTRQTNRLDIHPSEQ